MKDESQRTQSMLVKGYLAQMGGLLEGKAALGGAYLMREVLSKREQLIGNSCC